MAYNNIPYGQDMHDQAFFGGSTSNSDTFGSDYLGEISTSWMQNIDPLLRQTQHQGIDLPWQQQQPPPLQKWFTEPERILFTAGPLPNRSVSFPRLMRPNEGVQSLPKASRMMSPTPSQELSSQCSSARSPGAEIEYYPDSGYYSPREDYLQHPFSYSSHLSQGLTDHFQETQNVAFASFPGHVSLNQVQGFEDVNFEDGYTDMDLKNEYSIEVDTQMKSHGHTYRHSPTDSGLGASIKDEGSPPDTSTINVDDGITDADADAELDDEEIIPPTPASDTEYTPKSTRTRKRRGSFKDSPASNSKRRMTTASKPAKPKSSFPHTCKSCDHAPFKDAGSLQRHNNTAHTRAFVCVFAFAGCQSAFAAKNEWKRHVSSQHLNLHSWVCNLGACGKVGKKNGDGNGQTKGAEFNRKDLFTQHLRRMHAPFDVKRKNKKNPEWEDRLKELQVSCMRVKRLPPTRLRCPLDDCTTGFSFEGTSCWDERMEHVGKHLEKAAASSGAGKFEVHQEDDSLLVEWALRERIVERAPSGGFKFAGPWVERAEDEDADGEEE